MDKEHIKGAADKAKGAVKETIGKATGDKQMQAEGRFDKAKGEGPQGRRRPQGRRPQALSFARRRGRRIRSGGLFT